MYEFYVGKKRIGVSQTDIGIIIICCVIKSQVFTVNFRKF